jgi:hypothetical protein
MNAQANELKRTPAQMRADRVAVAIIVFSVLTTMFWNLSVGWLAFRLLDVL